MFGQDNFSTDYYSYQAAGKDNGAEPDQTAFSSRVRLRNTHCYLKL